MDTSLVRDPLEEGMWLTIGEFVVNARKAGLHGIVVSNPLLASVFVFESSGHF